MYRPEKEIELLTSVLSEKISAMAPVSWTSRLWFALLIISMIDLTQAGRKLKEAPKEIRLQAYSSEPQHAPPVKSFLVSDGTWVDCVPIEGQIAAHHPALKDHVIQMVPPKSTRESSSEPRRTQHPQLFAREHGGCPEGSIPVLRDDPAGRSMKKSPPPFVYRKSGGGDVTATSIDPAAPGEVHEYAITGVPNITHGYTGGYSKFSVNAPTLATASDMTLSQIWVIDGSYADNSLSTIEVGWQTQPAVNPTNQPFAPHLFIYWTKDAYKNLTGQGSCYNMKCPGFVQYSNTWVIGGPMPHYTTLAQNAAFEAEVGIEVLYDPAGKNWWLYLDAVPIGYWPASIFNSGYLQGTCTEIQWGGEVAFTRDFSTTTHTTLAMGSGAWPAAGWPVAAYQRNVSYADATRTWWSPPPSTLDLRRHFNNPYCYDIQIQQGAFTNWGSYFFFGGSGGVNTACHY